MLNILASTLKIVIGTALSFIVVHILSVFGVFVAAAYPIWWFISPNTTVCISCRSKKVGEKCYLCNRNREENDSNFAPKRFLSAFANALLILLMTVMSVTVVYGESRLLKVLGLSPTKKTAAFVIPAKGQYRLGEVFPMKVEITGMNVPVNAVQADLGFDSAKLEIMDISTDGSFASIFVQKEINNQAGYARLTGGLPSPGYSKSEGLFGTIYFKAKEPGLVKVEFLPTSLVLANDGRGSNILRTLSSTSYLILSERITAEEEQLFMEQKLAKPNVGSAVLGLGTDNTQLILYDESHVLGTQTSTESTLDQKPRKSIWAKAGEMLVAFDHAVIENWEKVIKLEFLK